MSAKRSSWTGAWHPLAERFPMLTEDELREMAASVAERGQYVPCRMSPEGLGLDGRNRVAACALAKVEPLWEVYGGEPVAFIVEINAERRHLTTGQRAIAVAIGLVEAGKRSDGKFKPGSVPVVNGRSSVSAWSKAIQFAGVVLDHAPDLADPVLRGEMALDAAFKQADEVRKGKARLLAVGGELAALVETGVIDVAEAERRADEQARLVVLAEDLADRVRANALSLSEAETIATERAERVAAWGEKVSDALTVLRPMAGASVPAELEATLTPDERAELASVLAVLSPEGVPA